MRRIDREEQGQGLVEYALILALVSLAAIVALGFLSGKINGLFSKAGNTLNTISLTGGPVTPPGPPPCPNAEPLSNQTIDLGAMVNVTGGCTATVVSVVVSAGTSGFPGTWLRDADVVADNPGDHSANGVYREPGPGGPVQDDVLCGFTLSNGYSHVQVWDIHVDRWDNLLTAGNENYDWTCF